MTTHNAQASGAEHREIRTVGRIYSTGGVVFLSIMVALGAALYEDVSAVLRTAVGLAIAASMVLGGQLLSRRRNAEQWFPVTTVTVGYALAYFFCYSTFYVPGLQTLETPYTAWVLGLTLGLIGTLHGSINKNLRWIGSGITLLATGHATFHALSSQQVVSIAGMHVQVAALGCFVGMLWCASLSWVNNRLALRQNWWWNYVQHEAYFVFAALNAMALPLFLSSFEQAPIWWSVEAPILLSMIWLMERSHEEERTGWLWLAKYFKHGTVALIWAAAVISLLGNAAKHPVELAVLLSVPLSGLAIGLAYRSRFTANWLKELRVGGYCLYLYVGIAVALLAPYIEFGNVWDAMPYWMIEALVLCGLGLLLRDFFVHLAGTLAALGALALFGLKFNTWTWDLVGPVVACSYALSVAYNQLGKRPQWRKHTNFLPFDVPETVSADAAEKLETLWSWVGGLTLFVASYVLVNHANTVIYWSLEAFVLVVLGFLAQKIGFRLQALLGFTAAAGKLVIWDVSGGSLGLHAAEPVTLYHAFQFGVLGASMLAASFLYFREEARRKLLDAQRRDGSGEPRTGTLAPEQSLDSPVSEQPRAEDANGGNASGANARDGGDADGRHTRGDGTRDADGGGGVHPGERPSDGPEDGNDN